MKKIGKIFTTIAILLSIVAIFVAGCNFGGSNNTQSGNSGNNASGGSGGNSSSGGNNNNQQQEELPAPEFESGSGTENDPYIISQPYQWTNISKHLSAYYELGADLNMGDITDLKPVGSDTAPFTGYLDGKNHKVHSATLSTALFGTISEGTVKNLNFADSTINNAVASFADTVKMGATVENCHTDSITAASKSGNSSGVGGFIYNVTSASKVSYCSANIVYDTKSSYCYIGGIFYKITGGYVDGCCVTGTYHSDKHVEWGSIVYSLTSGAATNCYSDCVFTGSGYAVGFSGHIASERTGGTMNYLIDFNDYVDLEDISIGNSSLTSYIELFYETTVKTEKTLGFYGPSTIESSNDLLDTDEWKDNKLWKKGKLHPELVSYEEYLQITAEN